MSQPKIQTKLLSNGLTLIGEVNPSSKSAALGFFVETGARDETPEESGVSHFLEHMMFKGTKKRTALEITYDIGNIGAQTNAYTSDESTVYYGGVIPEYFARLQELLSDMIRPALAPEEFDTEKKVILEEIAQYQDRPQFYLFENAINEYFGTHPAGNSVLGTESSISALSCEAMQQYFNKRYCPGSMTLAASGAFDWERFCDDAEAQCGHWCGSKEKREPISFAPPLIEKIFRRKNLNQSHVLLLGNGVDYQSSHRYPLAILGNILGDSQGSRLYWELVDKGIVDFAGADSDTKYDAGCFLVYASTDPGRIEEVTEKLLKVLSDPMSFSEDDLERVKTKVITRIVLSGELPMGRLMALGNEWLCRQRLHSLKGQIDEVQSVSIQDIRNAVEQIGFTQWSRFSLLAEE